MKKLLVILTILVSVSSFAETIQAIRNCDLAINMDFSQVDTVALGAFLSSRGYTFELEGVTHNDYPLNEEFLLSVSINDGFPVTATAMLMWQKEVGNGAKSIYNQEKKSLSSKKAVMKAIKELPNCHFMD